MATVVCGVSSAGGKQAAVGRICDKTKCDWLSLYKQSLLPYTFSHTTDSALSKCNDINHTVSAATGM